jgi:branched-subunit amino acid aminotransferase/4-amino-4-deoxychorismate lyase
MVAGSGESETGIAPGELGPRETATKTSHNDPTVCIHTFPVPFRLWAEKYDGGDALVTTSIEQVSPRSWPPELKCRSRMHYYLADREARAKQPGARAVMHDEHGSLTETTTANILLHREGAGLITPPRAKVLPGISLAVLRELAATLPIPVAEQDLRPDDVASADEVLLTSTSPCVLPVVSFNGHPIGNGRPGAVFRKLLAAWSEMVGIDIADQARKFARR